MTKKDEGTNNSVNEDANKEDSNINNDFLDNIVGKKTTKEKTHVFKGFYLEREVANVIDENAAGKPKGVKSEIVNESLKRVFKEMGWME
ncbi:hypothetical protein GLW04_19380 [Halobacillus litoralis]|uniref:Uncharacterized protein n=1 Tax=Halobacillus litoralis TaxID=45668 RepID=A0A845DWW4_9BACI|nr:MULTISPECIES: hypothetical protein [Halobacillus]MYL22040.1 hypothetical protein [Halobacillus litoralis]MYL31965.1 hypothetical protein [Halobacillus halophilus]MYL39969.1 hypothetical protein [Halobacillus litoralis]